MAYITRCPTCGCIYEISVEELHRGGGYCRCGVCQCEFDAKESLREIDPKVLRSLLNRAAAPAAQPPEPPAPPPPAAPAAAPQQAPLRASPAAAPQNFTVFTPKRAFPDGDRRRGLPWGFWAAGSAVLLLVLAWQLLSLFGPALSRHVPGLLSLRQSVCTALPCPGPGSDKANPYAIEDFALRPQSYDRYEISFTLVNNGAGNERLPVIEVSFSDDKGLITTRRYLKPSEYAGQNAQGSIAGAGSVPVRFSFSLAGDRPVSCQVKALD
ncbi:DUF3426 domain-containing protein [Mesosutterella sp. OilRF-GAM-744-9]|uniref:DUF3426 domain-containing protein n=1 Tax=Mesosutterella porci TaxID=2915351 RepID=A0ABS9MSJ2_9BURK|nr:zinc-ribbon and DUF3426 domain-containing protein [Mesosutterella sp. oilRF-744-WT-GAM-9]MCG5031294.1 DUF3426 domain-containing protein [Mesosutterella sp. oilRF-744-WT-GAM-9]